MRVELARTAGFCYGVRRAVQLAEEAAGQGRPCVMLGPIIHNRDGLPAPWAWAWPPRWRRPG